MVLIDWIPEFSDIAPYILINLGQWTYMDLSYNYVIFGMVYVVIMLIVLNIIKGVKFTTLVFFVILNQCLMQISQFSLLLVRTLDFRSIFLLQLFQNFTDYFSADVNAIIVLGRVTRFLPEGFECTGITVLVAISNFGIISGSILAARELETF